MSVRKFDSANIELVDQILGMFNDTSEGPVVAFLEKRGYFYDIQDEVWHVSPGQTIDLIDGICFKFLMEEWDWGPPVLFRYKPKKPYVPGPTTGYN